MSWLQDALGKAEDMLNTLDQQAASAFEEGGSLAGKHKFTLGGDDGTLTSVKVHDPMTSSTHSIGYPFTPNENRSSTPIGYGRVQFKNQSKK